MKKVMPSTLFGVFIYLGTTATVATSNPATTTRTTKIATAGTGIGLLENNLIIYPIIPI